MGMPRGAPRKAPGALLDLPRAIFGARGRVVVVVVVVVVAVVVVVVVVVVVTIAATGIVVLFRSFLKVGCWMILGCWVSVWDVGPL